LVSKGIRFGGYGQAILCKMAGGSFMAMLQISGFLWLVWCAGKLSKAMSISSIVFEITVGLVLGPQLVSMMPPPYTQCGWSGMHNFHQTKRVNLREQLCSDSYAWKNLQVQDSGIWHAVDLLKGKECKDIRISWNNIFPKYPAVRRLANVTDDRRLKDSSWVFEPKTMNVTSTAMEDGTEYYCHPGGTAKKIHGCETGVNMDGKTMSVDEVKQSKDMVKCLKKGCENEIIHLCTIQPNIFSLIGHIGVSMMIFESGMHFDFQKSKKVGPQACLVAVIGTFLPLFVGLALTGALKGALATKWTNKDCNVGDFAVVSGCTTATEAGCADGQVWCGKPDPLGWYLPEGLAVGVSLAPTSVGIALKLLLEARCLQKDFGQLILTAAFVDDILSLIIFNVFFNVFSGEIDYFNCIGAPIIGIAMLFAGGSLGISFWPMVVGKMNDYFKQKDSTASLPRQDEALIFLVFALLLIYSTITFYLGTHLWGCFIAGMSFAMLHHAHHVWVMQTKRFTCWMLRVFFSCTVGFAIPIMKLLDPVAVGMGSILGVVACIGTKVVAGFFLGPTKFVVGWAMVGRAEFAYLIAEMAKGAGLITDEIFAWAIWSLLWATIFAPFLFRKVLNDYAKKIKDEEEAAERQESNDNAASPNKAHTQAGAQSANGWSAIKQISDKTDTVGVSMGGHAWRILDSSQALRFLIMFPHGESEQGACNQQRFKDLFNVLQEKCLVRIIKVECCTDESSSYCMYKIQPERGVVEVSDHLEFMQEQVFKSLENTGAHILWLPESSAIETNCKLAKVTVAMDVTKLTKPAQSMYKLVSKCADKQFLLVRSTMQLFGNTASIDLLVAHKDAKTQDPRSPPGSPKQGTRRSASMGLNKVEYAMENLLHAHTGIPEIKADELRGLKRAILAIGKEDERRVFVMMDPVSSVFGPVGEPLHDAKTLLVAQESGGNTVELRFSLNSMEFSILPEVLQTISKQNLNILSARLNESAVVQINVVVTSKSLDDHGEQKLLNALEDIVKVRQMAGVIELTNLNKEGEEPKSRQICLDQPNAAEQQSIGVL